MDLVVEYNGDFDSEEFSPDSKAMKVWVRSEAGGEDWKKSVLRR